MSEDTLLETVALTVARIETTVEKNTETLDEHTKLLNQLSKFDRVEDRLRVIETQLDIDSRQSARQS